MPSSDTHSDDDAPRGRFPVTELDYDLPAELIAHEPAERRAESRLLLLDRTTGALQDRQFGDLVDLLHPRDVLVLNNTRVLPAKFRLRRRTGGRIDGLFLLEQADGSWEVLLRNAGRIKPDESLSFAGINEPCPWSVKPQENLGQGRWRIGVEPADQAVEVLAKVGRAPLPPYIRRQGGTDAHDRHDAERYQTVYASQPGAVAAPTAGLHFTTEVLDELARRWIERVEVTLHVGLGTFSPVAVDDLTDHTIHAEWYALSASAAARLNAVRAAGGRIVAVGTTSVRVLESCVDAEGVLLPKSGWTRLFCYPPYTFRAVDAMLTNFHLPHSTLLALVMAYGGVEAIRQAYAHAVKSDYRFYSYGDAMFIA